MKRRVILCNTFYQLITAMQMRKTLFKEDEVYLLLSNHSNGADKVAERLAKTDFFTGVIFVESLADDRQSHNIARVIKETMSILNGNYDFGKKELFSIGQVDEFYYFNYLFSTIALFSLFYKKNKQIRASRFEEGILNYDSPLNEGNFEYMTKRVKLVHMLNKVMFRDNLIDRTNDFYCFYPGFYKGKLNAKEIPFIQQNDSIVAVLAECFALGDVSGKYQEKYIYFSSVYDFEGGEPIGEKEVIQEIARIVGIDNLLVKLHPRDIRKEEFKKICHVDENSNIPWEVIQLNMDCKDKVFITANSGSVLSVNMIIDHMSEVAFIYPCCNLEKNEVAKNNIKNIEMLLSDDSLKSRLTRVHVVSDCKTLKEEGK